MKKSFCKQENERILNSQLTIHWWNFGSKRLDFKGTAKEYLSSQLVKISTRYYIDEHLDIELCNIKVKLKVGSMDFAYSCKTMEDAIRMAINIRLAYLGDRSVFTFLGRTRTINK